jgi:hypothetical protein
VLTYNDSLQPTIRNDNVNQFKVGLFHIKRRDNDVDVPLFLPAIVRIVLSVSHYASRFSMCDSSKTRVVRLLH